MRFCGELAVFDYRGRKGRYREIAPSWTMGVLYESQVPTQPDSTRPSCTEGALIVCGESELFTSTYVSNSQYSVLDVNLHFQLGWCRPSCSTWKFKQFDFFSTVWASGRRRGR